RGVAGGEERGGEGGGGWGGFSGYFRQREGGKGEGAAGERSAHVFIRQSQPAARGGCRRVCRGWTEADGGGERPRQGGKGSPFACCRNQRLQGQQGLHRRSSRAGRIEIFASRAGGLGQGGRLRGRGLAQSRRHRARVAYRQGRIDGAYRARDGREGDHA